MVVKRGDMFYADLSPGVGSEQGGIRPVLIIQNDLGNRYSPTVIAAAITSQTNKTKLPTHIELCIKEKGEKIAINEMRKHIAYYTKNLKDASSFRVKVNKIDNKKELIETLEKFFLQDNA